jgi:mannose-6-phosphate isomerase-like protein (cupin superfamily)
MPKIISKNNAEHYKWGDNCDGWHLLKTKDLWVIHEKVPPGKSEVRHYHKKSKQFFFVLKGAAIIEVDGAEHEVKENEGIYIDAEIPHQLFNKSETDLEFLVISSPPSHGDRTLA